MDAKNVATMSGDDFNALFTPMLGRGGIVQFDKGSEVLEAVDRALVERIYSERRGASYFFVVARASPERPHIRRQMRGNSDVCWNSVTSRPPCS